MKLRVSLLVWLYAFIMAAAGKFAVFLAYLAAVSVHELAHAECARRRGYALTELRLMPYGAALIGEIEDAPPSDEWRIAAVGPAASLLMAALSCALWWAVPASYYFTCDFALASLSLGLTNLLPVYPLDGGRIALALLSVRAGRAKAYRGLRIAGIAIGAATAALFVLSCFYGANVTLATMSAFMLISSIFPDDSCRYRRLYAASGRAARLIRGLRVREVMVSASAPARVLLRHYAGEYYTVFVVVDERLNERARLTERDLESVPAAAFSGSVGGVVGASERVKVALPAPSERKLR